GRGGLGVRRDLPVPGGAPRGAGPGPPGGGVSPAGERVQVTGITKGRGTAGVIKRHGFGGFPASHGTHEYFRHGGSIGNRSYPGRVFKGKRMAGRLGAERITTRNLEVVALRPEEHLILVRGAVPGARNGTVVLTRAAEATPQGGGGDAPGTRQANDEGRVPLPVLSPERPPAGDLVVPAAVVAGRVREPLLYEMVKSQLASRRAGPAAAKTRHFVSGGGKKPW